MEQRAKKKPPTSASWKPGVSGNPAGRPRTGQAFAERGRERFSPDDLLDLAAEALADKSLSAERRIAILLPIYDRIYPKPPTSSEVQLTSTTIDAGKWKNATDEDRQRLRDAIALLEAGPAPTTEPAAESSHVCVEAVP